jgi:hypothetical protein
MKGRRTQKAQYTKAQNLAQSELNDAETLASGQADEAIKLAVEQQKQELKKATQGRQEKMSEIARSGVEEGADGALELNPLEALLQLAEEPSDSSAAISSAELIRQQEKEREENERKANTMIAESKQSTNEVLMAKKIEDLKLAESTAINNAMEKARSVVAAEEAKELKAHEEADDAYMNIEEAAERKFREAKQQIGQKAAQLKIGATVLKNQEYNDATEAWEASKKEAREEQMRAFKQIESKEEHAMQQQKVDNEAAGEAIKAHYEQETNAIEDKKKQRMAVANQQADLGLSKVAQQTLHTQQELITKVAEQTSDTEPGIMH